MELVLNFAARYPVANEISSLLSWFSRNRLLVELQDRPQADRTGFCRHGVIAQMAAQLIGNATCPVKQWPASARKAARVRVVWDRNVTRIEL
jgi:hypothetical protein